MPDEITTASTASIKTIKNLKTDQIIYPVTKANAVYLNSTVEGEGETPVLQTVQGKLNDTRDDLDFWIKNDNIEASTAYSSDGYYVRIGVNKKGNGYAPPYAFMDIRDLNDTSTTLSGALRANFIMTTKRDDADKVHSNSIVTTRDFRTVINDNDVSMASTDPYVSLRQLVGKANQTGLSSLASTVDLDNNLRDNVLYYVPENGLNLGLPFSHGYVLQLSANDTYHTQFAFQYNSANWIMMRSKSYANATYPWNAWHEIVRNTVAKNDSDNTYFTAQNNCTVTNCEMQKRNGVRIINVSLTVPSGTYANSTTGAFFQITDQYDRPAGTTRGIISSTNGSTVVPVTLTTTGYLYPAASKTFSSNTSLVGQIVYSIKN